MKYTTALAAFAFCLALPPAAHPQGRGRGGAGGAAASAQAAAPIDLTGYWVSLVTDNWTYRVITPPKGDYPYLPLNPEGRRVADTWDPAKDETAGEQCKGYGAVGVMRLPTRLHVTWQDANTLKLETDTGTQTRLFHFAASEAPAAPRAWQGYSAAEWQLPGSGRGRGGQGAGAPKAGTLKVTTTQMRPGYIQKNGVPYSENAVLTEYFTVVEDKGLTILIDTLVLEDPQYLTQTFVRSAQFKKQPDATGWEASACSAK